MSLIKYNWPVLSDLFDDDWMKSRFTKEDWSRQLTLSIIRTTMKLKWLHQELRRKIFGGRRKWCTHR